MGINVISNAQSQEVTLAATSAMSAGNLVVQTEGGLVYPASSQVTTAGHNVTTAGPSAIQPFFTALSTGYRTFASDFDNCVQLGNGLIAVAYAGDGTTADTGVNVGYYTQSGGVAQTRTSVVTTAVITSVRVRRINATSFVVVWCVGGTLTLRFAVYNNDGTNLVAATTVTSSLATSTPNSFNFNVLTNGNIVFAYRKATSLDTVFSMYNSSGVLQGSETIVEAASTGIYITVLAHSSGDFWIYYKRNVATTGYKFARYNNSGALQGSLTTVSANSGTPVTNWDKIAVELGNGNVLFFAPTASHWMDAFVYNSTGTFVASNTTWHDSSGTTSLAQMVPAVLVESSRATLFSYASTGIAGFWKIDNSLNFFTPRVAMSAAIGSVTVGSGSVGVLKAYSEGSAGYSIAVAGYNGTNYTATVGCCDLNGTVVGTSINMISGGTNVFGVNAIKTTEGNIVSVMNDTITNIKLGVYCPSRRNVIGVAQEAASAGSNFRCATVGTYTLNNAPLNAGSFDNRTATPGGCKGNVSGTTAVLSGLV